MAITIKGFPSTDPNAIYSGFNPIVFYLDSTQKTQPSFRYMARFLDSSSNPLFTKELYPRPADGYGVFSAATEVSSLLNYDISWDVDSSGVHASNSYITSTFQTAEVWKLQRNFTSQGFIDVAGIKSHLPLWINPTNFDNFTFLTLQGIAASQFVEGDLIYVEFDNPPAYPKIQGTHRVIATFTDTVPNPDIVYVVLDLPFQGSTPGAETGFIRFADNRLTYGEPWTSRMVFTALNTTIDTHKWPTFGDSFSTTYNMSGTSGDKKMLSNIDSVITVRDTNHAFINWSNFQSTNLPTHIIFTSDVGSIFALALPAYDPNKKLYQTNLGPSRTNWGIPLVGTTFLLPDTKWYSARFVQAVVSLYVAFDYVVNDYTQDYNISAPVSQEYRFNIDRSCAWEENIEALFLDKLGSILPMNFIGRNTLELSSTTVTYKTNKNELVIDPQLGNHNTYDLTKTGTRIINGHTTKTMTLNTGVLTDDGLQRAVLLLSSPVTLFKIDGIWQSAIVKTKKIEYVGKTDKIKRLTIEITLSEPNNYNI